MQFWSTFFLYSGWSLQFLWARPSVTTVFLLIIAASLVRQIVRKEPFRRGYILLFQLLFWPAIIVVGVLGHIDPQTPESHSEPIRAAVWALNGLCFLSLITGGYLVFKLKGSRWLAASIILFEEWMMLWAGVVSGMSITGDWL